MSWLRCAHNIRPALACQVWYGRRLYDLDTFSLDDLPDSPVRRTVVYGHMTVLYCCRQLCANDWLPRSKQMGKRILRMMLVPVLQRPLLRQTSRGVLMQRFLSRCVVPPAICSYSTAGVVVSALLVLSSLRIVFQCSWTNICPLPLHRKQIRWTWWGQQCRLLIVMQRMVMHGTAGALGSRTRKRTPIDCLSHQRSPLKVHTGLILWIRLISQQLQSYARLMQEAAACDPFDWSNGVMLPYQKLHD